MKEFEITVKLENSKEEAINILENNGFELYRKSLLIDTYMLKNDIDYISQDNKKVLNNCIILRNINNNINYVIYRKKEYDERGNTIKRDTYELLVDNIDVAKELFLNIGYKELIHIEDDSVTYKKDDITSIIEDVCDLGLFLEIEIDVNSINENTIENVTSMFRNMGFEFSSDYDVKKAELMLNKKRNIEKIDKK